MDWKHGYFADNGYTFGYYREMAPCYLAWAALLQGVVAPTRNFRYVDLGCGQGLGLILQAACHPDSEFVGVDFMPSHIAHARRLAQAGGISNVRFIEGDFTALQNDPSTLVDATGAPLDGQADYVVAHGIASWVSPSVRASLSALAGRLLKPGGLHYTSYNTEPGWLAAKPFQHLVMLRQGQGRTGAQALRSGMDTFAALDAAKSKIYATFTTLKPRLDVAASQDIAYLTQEYNNRYWEPLRVSDMMAAASAAKLDWVGSATLPEQFGNLLPAEIAKIIDSESDPVLRETVRDLAVVQSFRRDMYVKGSNVAWPSERLRRVSDTRVVASHLLPLPQGNDGKMEIMTTLGKVRVNRAACQAILDRAGEQGATLAELQQGPGRTEPLGSMVQKVTLLIHAGLLYLQHATDASARELNRALAQGICDGAPYKFLAAPRLGEATGVDGLNAMLFAACADDEQAGNPTPVLALVLDRLAVLRQRVQLSLQVDGRDETGGPVFEAELEKRARSYIENQWPAMKRLQMA
jgi:SAM-dependent methyltransferase